MNQRNEDTHSYDDIINLPHPTSAVHPRMPNADRAAQFAPFAALNGHDEAISETARLTWGKRELSDDQIISIYNKLNILNINLHKSPVVIVTYYVEDTKKSGGKYVRHMAAVKKLDDCEQQIIMDDGTKIQFDSIFDISSDDIDLSPML